MKFWFGKSKEPLPLSPRPPRLTAVVLSYNKKDEIRRFAASLFRQTRMPDELLVVDDASLDAPASYYQDIFRSWPVIRLKENGGQSHARNVGCSYAKGEFIIFLDGDIEMRPNMLEKMEETLLVNADASIAYCHYDRVGSRTDHAHAKPWDRKLLKETNYISMISMVRTKDLPQPPLDPELRRYEDWDLWLRMADQGKVGVLVDEVLFTAHYKKGDLSGTGESVDWYKIVREKHGLSS